MDFNSIKNEISQVPPEEPVFIYIGVGTMAGLLESDGTLAPSNYHQFPPFVQDLRIRFPHVNLFLILIDPLQENPPYLVRDFPLKEINPDHYKSDNNRLQVFVMRKAVYTDPDDRENYAEHAINITESLRDLNDFALAQRASLLYHDFTGRRTASIAEYFQYDYLQVLDQIVYAMSAREHHGCYFDLTKPNAFFATKIEREGNNNNNNNLRPIIKMFNYFKYTISQKYKQADEEASIYPSYMQPFIEEQKQHIINDIRTEFKNTHIAALRQINKILLHPTEDVDPNIYLYSGFIKYERDLLLELLKVKDYALLHDILFNMCATKLDVLASLKNMAITGEQVLKFITADPDPYQWYKSIDELLGKEPPSASLAFWGVP